MRWPLVTSETCCGPDDECTCSRSSQGTRDPIKFSRCFSIAETLWRVGSRWCGQDARDEYFIGGGKMRAGGVKPIVLRIRSLANYVWKFMQLCAWGVQPDVCFLIQRNVFVSSFFAVLVLVNMNKYKSLTIWRNKVVRFFRKNCTCSWIVLNGWSPRWSVFIKFGNLK